MAAGARSLFELAQQAEQRGNREGRDLWDRYATHRAQIRQVLLTQAPPPGKDPGPKLCLMGAGNANDLDLTAIGAAFAEVHLVDIDPSALARATGRQEAPVRAKLRCHGGVDLSGLFRQMGGKPARAKAASGPRASDLVDAGTSEVLGALPGGFDVVASCCMLSQMSWALRELGGFEPEELPSFEQALLTIHLRTLLGLLAPGGTAILFADLVSSAVYPLDELEPDTDLAALVQKLSDARSAVTVCNPGFIRQLLRRDPVLVARAAPPEMGQPWLWTGSKDLTFLVYPLILRGKDNG